MSKERVKWIDITKGMLIVLVIIGHASSNTGFRDVISSFYMPCFFLLSGYVLSEKGTVWERLVKRVKTVLLPYFVFSVILIVTSIARAWLTNGSYSTGSALISIFLPYAGRTGGSVYQLWFLPCLFLAQSIIDLLRSKGAPRFIGAGLWILMLFTGVCLSHTSLLLAAAVAAIFILIGYGIKRRVAMRYSWWILVASFAVFLASCGINCGLLNKRVDFSGCNFGVFPLFLLSSLSGSLCIIQLAMWIQKWPVAEYIGKRSLYYYGLHYPVLSAAGFLCERILGKGALCETVTFVLTLLGTTVVVICYERARDFLTEQALRRKEKL